MMQSNIGVSFCETVPLTIVYDTKAWKIIEITIVYYQLFLTIYILHSTYFLLSKFCTKYSWIFLNFILYILFITIDIFFIVQVGIFKNILKYSKSFININVFIFQTFYNFRPFVPQTFCLSRPFVPQTFCPVDETFCLKTFCPCITVVVNSRLLVYSYT